MSEDAEPRHAEGFDNDTDFLLSNHVTKEELLRAIDSMNERRQPVFDAFEEYDARTCGCDRALHDCELKRSRL